MRFTTPRHLLSLPSATGVGNGGNTAESDTLATAIPSLLTRR